MGFFDVLKDFGEYMQEEAEKSQTRFERAESRYEKRSDSELLDILDSDSILYSIEDKRACRKILRGRGYPV